MYLTRGETWSILFLTGLFYMVMPWSDNLTKFQQLICLICMMLVSLGVVAVVEVIFDAINEKR